MRNIFFSAIVFVLTILILYYQYRLWAFNAFIDSSKSIDYEAFGTYGDFFGGVIGTLFAIIGVIYVYRTYHNQATFHKKEQIESRFFELLKLHEKNVEDLITIDNNIFKIYLSNISSFVIIIDRFNKEHNKSWSNEVELKLAYLYFFYGSSNYTKDRLKGIEVEKDEVNLLSEYMRNFGISYKGVYPEFGKYFRQLFQMVNYIDNKSELKYIDKVQYIKSLRVRLNLEEQYLLFLNSLVSNGLDWEKGKTDPNKQLITKYNLLKNIPIEYEQINNIDLIAYYPDIQYEYLGDVKSDQRKRLENLYR